MMKKITVLYMILALVTVVASVSCQGIIFSDIRKEVKLADSSVPGDVNSIVRFTMNGSEYLFVDNGKIFYKNVTENADVRGAWKASAMSGLDVDRVIRLASDDTYVYAFGVVLGEDEDEGDTIETERRLYCSTDGESWEQVSISALPYTGTIFCNNAASGKRKAYINLLGIAAAVYELKGADTPLAHSATVLGTAGAAKSAAYFNNTEYISSYYGMTSTDSCLYYGNGDIVYYSLDGSSWESRDVDEGSILALSVTSDYLILGTTSGYAHVGLVGGKPLGGTGDLPANVESALSSAYEVYSVLAVDASKPETQTDVYASATYSGSSSSSSATRSKEGLWGYHPSEDEWNLD